jgi:hypothetical protein
MCHRILTSYNFAESKIVFANRGLINGLCCFPIQGDARVKKRAKFNPMRHLMMQTLWETAVGFLF